MTEASEESAIGVIGGTGLYEIPDLQITDHIEVQTAFGSPSDRLLEGRLAGRRVVFLPRHGIGHRLLPTEINHRANILALRRCAVRCIVAFSAVGSLQEQYPPRHLVLPDQFFDRTSRREHHTFFGNGIVAHISFDQPTSAVLRRIIHKTALGLGLPIHEGGTYVNIDGPAFSTRAESQLNHRLGFDVIGMTNLPEAKLAREAEIAYANVCLVTDFDSWRHEGNGVDAKTIMEHLHANAESARKLLVALIPHLPLESVLEEHRALDSALVTDKGLWPENTVRNLSPILDRFL